MKKTNVLGLLMLGLAALLIVICAMMAGVECYGQTTQPSTQPGNYSQQFATVGQSIDNLLAARDQQLSLAQSRSADLQKQLDAANAQITSLKSPPASSSVPAGTDLSTIATSGKPGTYIFDGGDWTISGSPTLATDGLKLIGRNGARLNTSLAPGAGAWLTLACNGSEVSGFVINGPGLLRVRGKDAIPAIDAAGYPGRYPYGNVIKDNEFGVRINGDVIVHATARNTVILHNIFHVNSGDSIFDTGYRTLVAHNTFEGSTGDHSYRQDGEPPVGYASDSVVAFNYSDNRAASANHLEDFTFRSPNGSVVIGNTLMAWQSITSGGPSYWRSNVIPTLRPGGALVQSDSGKAMLSLYFDENYLAPSTTDSGVTVFGSGNLITRNNSLINPPQVYKQAFATIPNGTAPFVGQRIEIGDGNHLVLPTTRSSN